MVYGVLLRIFHYARYRALCAVSGLLDAANYYSLSFTDDESAARFVLTCCNPEPSEEGAAKGTAIAIGAGFFIGTGGKGCAIPVCFLDRTCSKLAVLVAERDCVASGKTTSVAGVTVPA